MGCAGEANAAGERAGVYARQANAVVGLHPLIKGLDITEIAWLRHILTHNAAKGMGRVSLHIRKIGADIADMGKGEVDDLPGIARVSHDLLIAGHRRVEADLANRLANRAETATDQAGTVSKAQYPPRSCGPGQGCGEVGRTEGR